ncbi:hypothetical protein D3C81_2142170 [compost metagenome]
MDELQLLGSGRLSDVLARELGEIRLPVRMPLRKAVGVSSIAHCVRPESAFLLQVGCDADCLLGRPTLGAKEVDDRRC